MPTSNWPTGVEAVGAILRARTRDTNGNEVGTFSTETRPTQEQVEGLIYVAVSDLASCVGPDIEEQYWEQAAVIVSYKVAMLVELSYFPEQVATGRSPYEQLKELYTDALACLKAAVLGGGTGLPGDPSSLPGEPSYCFPVANTLDHVLGPVPGGYLVPWSGGLFQ